MKLQKKTGCDHSGPEEATPEFRITRAWLTPSAMADLRIQVDGLRDLQRQFAKLGAETKRELREVNLEAAKSVVPAAAHRVPVRTGRLRRSVRARASQRDARVVAGGKAVPYAPVIEFGNPRRGIAPQPFLFPAARSERPRVVALYRHALDRLIRRHF